MYSLYDRDGMLRFVNADREACLDYAELFELNSSHFCLMHLIEKISDSDLRITKHGKFSFVPMLSNKENRS